MSNEISDTELYEEFHAVMEKIKHEIPRNGYQTETAMKIEPETLRSFRLYEADDLMQCENEYSLQSDPKIQEKFNTDDNKTVPSLCRLCAFQKRDTVYIFTLNETYKNIIEKIEYCLPIVVKIDDTLSKRVCQLCLEKLEFCNEFYKAVEEAEKQLIKFNSESQGADKKEGKVRRASPSGGSEPVAKKRTSNRGKLKISSTSFKELKTTEKSVENNALHLSSNRFSRRKRRRRSSSSEDQNANSSRISAPRNGTAISPISQSDILPCSVRLRNLLLGPAKNVSNSELHSPPITKSLKSRIVNKKLKEMSGCKKIDKDERLFKDAVAVLKQPQKYCSDTSESQLSAGKPSDSSLPINNVSELPKEVCPMISSFGVKLSCPYCEKTFTYKPHLVGHIRTHTGEQPFGCSICPKKFGTVSARAFHVKAHIGKRPYECSICKRKFVRSVALKQHMITHSENKPHACPVCDRSFNRKYSRNRHFLFVHSEKKDPPTQHVRK